VNHRLFAHELGGGLPQQAYVQSREELAQRLGNYEQRWLLKRALSFAGRGQLRIIGPLTEKQESWVALSLGRDGLLLEPLVEPVLEVSLHGFVWRGGSFRLGRVCVQDVSARGTFRGLRLAGPGELGEEEQAAFWQHAELTARALHGAGYFGPFGIDGYRYHDADRQRFCALGEINARYTLGFSTGFPEPASALRLD
jgi:phosphoribosylaminoimidazole carboxylase (NCAIR synthetase)